MIRRHLNIFFTLLIGSFQLPSFGQQAARPGKLETAQKHLLEQIAKYGKVESRTIGRVATYSEQYTRFSSLAKISTESDIFFFTTSRSPAVKIYAFQELLKHKQIDKALIALQNNIQDTTAFLIQNGCIKSASIVSKSMYSRLVDTLNKNGITWSDQQKALLATLDKQLPTYSHVRKMVARQIKDDEY
jgi:hypothetical protein